MGWAARQRKVCDKFLVRASRVFGDPKNCQHWDAGETYGFYIKYKNSK